MISFNNFTSTTKFCDEWIWRSFRLDFTAPTYVKSNSENILFYLVNKVNLSLVVFHVKEWGKSRPIITCPAGNKVLL